MTSKRVAVACAAWFCVAGVITSSQDVADAVRDAAAQDDECALDHGRGSGGGEVCALSALQRRSLLTKIASVAQADSGGLADAESSGGETGATGAHAPQEQTVMAPLPDGPDFEVHDDFGSSADEDTDITPSVGVPLGDDDDDLFDDHPVTKIYSGCHAFNGTAGIPCPMGLTCVVRYDEKWSQCVDCSVRKFGQVCQKLDDYMRYAAVHSCGLTCPDTKCYNQNWCVAPYRCIIDPEEVWGQCVSCRSKKFWGNSCHSLGEGMIDRAEKLCHRKCREY
eukprot:CAMPEP_0204108224 /NCGR_PEP_ID=MMETSP0361-20130328/589_1 /ASSEMBLY_ACC=CAM_ASM_000343 /TAXON_ID=268821 /ORGANISM="Scrippsiella Hangoei, Strain SHTV-5" /LENGTH=278 /DNA_ID=CAMNT_0051057817 /DNA_START=52 /DNA_END=888 /DNA_ORIENTATION=-